MGNHHHALLVVLGCVCVPKSPGQAWQQRGAIRLLVLEVCKQGCVGPG